MKTLQRAVFNKDSYCWEIYFSNIDNIPVLATAKTDDDKDLYNVMLDSVKYLKSRGLYFCKYQDI